MDREPPIEAAWDKNNDDAVSDIGDMKEDFMSKIDGEIDFDERYEVVGCIELSSASSAYARFKFVYFFLSLSEQFGFYWITLYGTIKYGYSKWLNWYIICLAFAGFISAFTSSIIGRLSDRYGRKYIILLSILIQSMPYIPLILLPNKIEYFLYLLPIIGFCGSISTLTGVMKAYIVDILPKRFLISGFAKLISIYGGAGIFSSIIIYSIIGNEIRNFFIENDFINFTTQIIMIITIGLYIFTFILFSIIVPESLYPDYKLKYRSRINPCHGINIALCNNKGVIIYTLFFIFFCSFAQIGMMAIIQDIFLIDFDLTNSINNRIDLINGTDNNNNANGSIYDILSDDLAIYGAFLFTLGCTLICAPCCIKCYCGKALTNMLCSMILMILSFCIIIFLLISNEWYTFIISLICGILFAMGEIGFVFLNGSIAKYINSKQYGIAYGLLHSIYSLSKACSPYIFYLLFEIFIQNNISVINTNASILGKAKPIVYIAIVLTIIGTFIGLFAIKKSMRNYKLLHQNVQVVINNNNNRHDYDRKHSQFDEGEMKNYDNDNEQVLSINNSNIPNENIEMQPPPIANNNSVHIIHNGNNNHQVQPSAVSSVYIVGHNAPQYQQQPYIAQSVNGHQPQWTVMQQQQQQQQPVPLSYNNLPSSSYKIQPYSQQNNNNQYPYDPSQHNSQPGYVASDVV